MKILHIISGDLWAGAEVMACHLLRQLHSNPKLDVSVILLNYGRLASELSDSGIQVDVIPENRNSILRIAIQIRKKLYFEQPKVIHSHRYKENFLAYLVSRNFNDICLVTTQHGLPESQSRKLTFSNRIKLKTNYLLLQCAFSSVVVVSRDIQSHFTTDLGFSSSQVPVVHNGIHLPESITSKFLNLPFVVGSCGRLFPVKDYPLMVQIARVVAHKSDIHFALAGDGPERSKLEYGIEFACLEGRFQLLGHLDDMGPFYAGLKVYINTSVHEGIPMTILEAMARGLPIIAPRVGGIPEVVDDGVQGFLIDGRDPEAFAEKIMLLYNDRELWQRMSLAAREKAERCFSVEKMAQGYLEIYRKLCGVRR